MLKIKLKRIGKRKQPFYRIIVAESKTKRDGKYIACLGFYNPLSKQASFTLDKKLYQEWLQKGAQPTERVRKLALK